MVIVDSCILTSTYIFYVLSIVGCELCVMGCKLCVGGCAWRSELVVDLDAFKEVRTFHTSSAICHDLLEQQSA